MSTQDCYQNITREQTKDKRFNRTCKQFVHNFKYSVTDTDIFIFQQPSAIIGGNVRLMDLKSACFNM